MWANVMRPRIPLVYLDLNSIICIARGLAGESSVHPAYSRLYNAAIVAKSEQRAAFPLGEAHLWEISKIKDPRQRNDLADVAEALSDYNYLLGRTVIAELEFEAGIGEDLDAHVVGLAVHVGDRVGRQFVDNTAVFLRNKGMFWTSSMVTTVVARSTASWWLSANVPAAA